MLNRIPDRYFEYGGTFFGLMASVSIAMQVIHELRSDGPTTLSGWYVAGFLVIFMYWTLYGIRFRRPALWLTNGVAVAMQTILLVVTLA